MIGGGTLVTKDVPAGSVVMDKGDKVMRSRIVCNDNSAGQGD